LYMLEQREMCIYRHFTKWSIAN